MKKIVPLIIILGLFALSLWIRLPNMNRPLGDHHEWVTEHTLIILKNWEAQGALKHHFCLLMTFPGKNNRWVFDYFGRMMSKHGYGYYPSFPPGAVVYPYLAFKTFGLKVTPLNLQMFNVICQFITALVLYWFIRKLLFSTYYPKEAIALIGVLFLLFLPNLMWFCSNVYSWDIFWFYPYITGIALIVYLKKLIDENRRYRFILGLFSLNLFILIYSDYYGLLFSLAVIFYSVIMIRQNKAYIGIFLSACIFSVLPIVVILAQYQSVTGIKTFLHFLFSNANNYQTISFSEIKNLANHAFIAYKLIFIPLLVAIGYLMYQEKWKIFKIFSSIEYTALYFSLIPSAAFLILQAHWSANHNYSMLRLAPFLIILLAILLSKIRLPLYWSGYLLIYILVANFLSAAIFSYQKDFTYSRDPGFWKRQGQFVRKNSQKEQVIFGINPDSRVIDPRFTFYIRRNVQHVHSRLEAVAWLLAYNKEKGALFKFSLKENIIEPEEISTANLEKIFTEENIVSYEAKSGKFNKIASVEFILKNGEKEHFLFMNGALMDTTFYTPAGKKKEEYITDYWNHKTTHFIFDENEHVVHKNVELPE